MLDPRQASAATAHPRGVAKDGRKISIPENLS